MADEDEAISRKRSSAEVTRIRREIQSKTRAGAKNFYFLAQREKSVNSSIASWRRGSRR